METAIHDAEKMAHLADLHQANEREMLEAARRQFRGSDEEFSHLVDRYRHSSPAEQAGLLKQHGIELQADDLALGVSESTGRLLYQLARATRARRILELGSSTGLSTAWLAAALCDMGAGELVATEIVPAKIERLERLLGDLAVEPVVRIAAGDVFDTVAQLDGEFDLIFLDVWARDYLKLLRAVEPLSRPGTVLLADNISSHGDELWSFTDYVNTSPQWSPLILPIESGVLFAVKV